MHKPALLEKFRSATDLKLLMVAATCCCAIWIFVELADDAPEGDYLHIEKQILQLLRDSERPQEPVGPFWLEEAALELTSLGSLPVLIFVVALCLCHLMIIKKLRTALLVAVSTALGFCLTFFLKDYFERARPDSVSALVDVMTHSFPSGHAMTSSIVYMTLGALLAQAATRSIEKTYFIAAALLLSFVIGLTRIYLGVHYPTDVLAGWAAGTAWALICWCVPHWYTRFKAAEQS